MCDKKHLRKGNFESLLDRLQNLLIGISTNERDGKTLSTESASTTDTVEVRISVCGQIVVDGEVDALNIDTTTEDIGSDTDTLVEVLELLVAFDTAKRLA